MSKNTKLYAEICKTEKQDDGTIIVSGYASSGAVDSDGEIITPEAMKSALPDYMKFGAVREMHQPLAAGTAIEANVEEDGRTFFRAHVVDPVAVKKVETGVYKGFSIGGKVVSRDDLNKSIVTGLKLVEVSLVDRPANPEAVITVFKMEGEGDEEVSAIDALADLLNKGEITPEKLLSLAKGEAVVAGEPVDAAGEGQTAAANTAQAADGAAEKSGNANDLKKGMFDLASLVQILDWIGCLAENTEWESQFEGDESGLPQKLRDWLAQGVTIFREMADEETSEMMARLKEMAGPESEEVSDGDDVAMAAKGGNVTKAGARFSKGTKATLSELHKAIQTANEHLNNLGYNDADGDEGGADNDKDGDGKKKSEDAADLAKRASEALSKVDQLEQDLAKSQARVAELEAQPAPGKALLKAVTISKGEDAHGVAQQSEPEPIRKADGSIDGEATALALIKFQHEHGGVRIR